jgi:formylglycine-generating enzyme required for sulfatase activity
MADIFVCYRREDAQWSAGRVNDSLAQAFGHGRVFFDTVTIQPGEDFVEVLGAMVGDCRVLLAVIGPNWLDILDKRLGDDNDFVRIEIAEALRRNIRVVPVLIDGARPPPAERLPAEIRTLSQLHAVPIRAETFHADVDRLIQFLKKFLNAGASGANPEEARELPVAIDATDQRRREVAEEQAEAARRKTEGLIQLRIGDRRNDDIRWLRPGAGRKQYFKDHPAGPEMVVVPAGTFLMGSRNGEGDDDERPQHKVTIVRPFAVSRFAVTFDEWDAAYGRGGVKHRPGGWLRVRGRLPVINVSWEDAQAYAGWLSRETGKSYRLLSEAEWEYCCRAGTTTAYSGGDTIDKIQARFGRWLAGPVEVGSFPPNVWGLHDMHGNVWEWCEDNWHPNYQGAPQDGSVWRGGDTSFRVLRGGSWFYVPQNLRSADRRWARPGFRNYDVGFRVARTL